MLCARVAAQLGLVAMNSAELNGLALSLERIRFSEALARAVVVARDAAGHRIAVVADPYDAALQDWLAAVLPESFELRIATRDDITAALARYEESQRASTGLLDENDRVSASSAEVLSLARIADDASPVVRVVNSTLYDALKQAASDIHLESVPAGMQVKYRIDGVLVRVGQVAGADTAEQVISRIKVWPNSTSPSGACRRTAASRSPTPAATSTCACPSCPACTARTRCCGCSTRST
jgi:general secretion pathway protein E